MKFENMNEKKKVLWLRRETLFITILCVCFPSSLAIVGRDLVLTPRQGLQLNGKSIFYKEDSNDVLRNVTQHPWERTLKHVTFVTLFTDAAEKAVAGNISKLKEYTDFLKSPYIKNENANFIRFGDIVMLANGRLEAAGNHTFRFIEGTCDFNCHPERVWALWQVQKIRHRDQYQNFRYEMKFSVSPLRTANVQSNDLLAEAPKDQAPQQQRGEFYVKRSALKTYIQREDDYPHSFGRIIYPEETAFAQKRRADEGSAPRNFRQVSEVGGPFTPLTPQPQSTFMHPRYARLPPPPPPPPITPQQHLNIGEYLKGFLPHPQGSSKIELFPNQFNLMHRNGFSTGPTTFRPNFQVKLPRPEIYQNPPTDMVRFPVHHHHHDGNEANEIVSQLRPPLVTHHYHHHFFMPGSNEIGGNNNNSGENHINTNDDAPMIQQQQAAATPNYYRHQKKIVGGGGVDYFEAISTTPKQESNLLPAPHKISFPLTNIGEHIVEVTPPPFKAPHIYAVYPKSYPGKVPVLVYSSQATTSTQKPFINSESVTESVRYSEPDPLYPTDGQSNTQVESPYFNTVATITTKRAQPTHDEIEAQLPFPQKQEEIHQKSDQILNQSLKTLQFLPEDAMNLTLNDVITTATTEAIETTTSYDTPTTTEPTTPPPNRVVISPPRHVTTPISTTTETATSKPPHHSQIVSTSTNEPHLRTLSRKRLGRSTTTTTTTDATISKWKPKRRNQHRHFKHNPHTRREQFTSPSPSPPSMSSTFNPPPQNVDRVLEVLTQKSVSKSVSVKVGSNGDEIPIVGENEVARE